MVELIVNLHIDFAGKEGWQLLPINVTEEMQHKLSIHARLAYEKMFNHAPDFARQCGAESGQLSDWIVAATGEGKPNTDKYSAE